MFGISDLFQWRRFVSHTSVPFFYWLIVAVSVLVGLGGVASSLAFKGTSPFRRLAVLVTSVLGTLIGVILARIIAEPDSSYSPSASISARSATSEPPCRPEYYGFAPRPETGARSIFSASNRGGSLFSGEWDNFRKKCSKIRGKIWGWCPGEGRPK